MAHLVPKFLKTAQEICFQTVLSQIRGNIEMIFGLLIVVSRAILPVLEQCGWNRVKISRCVR